MVNDTVISNLPEDSKEAKSRKINSELVIDDPDDDKLDLTKYTRKCFKLKNKLAREVLAEILSTFVLIVFGCGSVAQYVLGGEKKNFAGFISVNFSWGLGVTMGILIAGKISGAHMNPAVSLSQLILGNISPLKFLLYVLGQFIGAFVGSAVVFVVYLDAINAFDGGVRATVGENATAGIWATYPGVDKLTPLGGFLDQVFGTAFLVLMVLAITDKKNAEIPHGLTALLIGSTVFVIGMSYGLNCGYALNPARDFVPRLFTAIAGYGTEVFKAGNYFFWIPIIAPFIGATLSTFIYAIFISNHWPDGSLKA